MAIDKETVKSVARLSRIRLEDEELERLSHQLKDILDFIDKLKKLDISGVEPTSHILPLKNVLRQDSPRASLPAEKSLANAPRKQGDFFVVPKVIE
jgi:aspartyl-tRNA(Asn)/glutamyl-tRNA(Gln) amidotransferase subunit C